MFCRLLAIAFANASRIPPPPPSTLSLRIMDSLEGLISSTLRKVVPFTISESNPASKGEVGEGVDTWGVGVVRGLEEEGGGGGGGGGAFFRGGGGGGFMLDFEGAA